ncbi:MAG TPA: ATP-binding protein [Thermoplasmata archaeon]|jgi:PAS domain S-box-containing protein
MNDESPTRDKTMPSLSLGKGEVEFGGKRVLLTDVLGGFYALKKTLSSEVGFFEKEFMFKAALEGAKEFLSTVSDTELPDDPKASMELMLEIYRQRGYGDFRIAEFDAKSRMAKIMCTNTTEAWPFLESKDLQRGSVCSYTSGILTWVSRRSIDRDASAESDVYVHESQCLAQGRSECVFVVGPASDLRQEFQDFQAPSISRSEHDLRLNEEILSKNLELQAINLTLERQIRRRTEDLWRSEANYKALMNLVPEPIAIVLPNGRLSSLNLAAANMLGVDHTQETHDLTTTSLLPDKATWDKIIWLLEKEGQITGFELVLVRPDGKKVHAKMSARFADLVPGRCVEAVFKDISEKKLMEQQIQEARSESDFFNDLLSHDIMNYTFSALHFLDSMWKSKTLTEENRKYLGMVTKDIQGAFELSTSIRDLSRLKALDGADTLVKDLKILILESVDETKRLFSDRTVKINFEKDTEPRFVKCNALTTRIFTNLLTNAVKFDPSDEAVVDVTVEGVTEGTDKYWKVSVADYGKGIPDEEKERIFDRFHRLDASVKGTGLGLYVARFIAQTSGGRLLAENRVKGDHTKGTRMVVLLKKADEKEVAKQNRISLGGH